MKGRFVAKAVDVALSKGKVAPMVTIKFSITEGEEAGKSTLYFGSLSEKAREYTVAALRTLGWKGVDFSDFVPGGPGVAALPNGVSIVVEEEVRDGKIRDKVRWVNELGGGGLKAEGALTAEEAKALTAELGLAPMPKPATGKVPF